MDTEEDMLFAAIDGGALFGISTATGSRIWQQENIADTGAPDLDGSSLGFFSQDGRLRVVGASHGEIRWSTRNVDSSGRLMVIDSAAFLYDPGTNSLTEYDLFDGTIRGRSVKIAVPPVLGPLYLVYDRHWAMPDQGFSLLNAIPVDSDGTVASPVLHEPAGLSESRLYCPSRTIYVAVPGEIQAYNLQGEGEQWTAKIDGFDPSVSLFLVECSDLLLMGYDNALLALDRDSGARVWRSEFETAVTAITMYDHSLYISTGREIMKLSMH